MGRKPYRVHHWTVGQRFTVPLPAGNILDFTIERDPNTGQLFAVWIEEREGKEGQVSVKWSRAPQLYSTWRKSSSVAHLRGEAYAPEIQFNGDRLLMTYLAHPMKRSGDAKPGTCNLHWKRVNGGPWSEGAVVRRRVIPPVPDTSFPYNYRVHESADDEGRTWALIRNHRFVEPTYALYPTSAPERALLPANPWEDQLIYTGVIAGVADHASLVYDRGAWHIVRRVFDDARDCYILEAIAIDMSILRHDHNSDGQTDILDSITELYDNDLLYMLWEEADYQPLFDELGTLIAVRHPNQHTRTDKSKSSDRARYVFETASTLCHVKTDPQRSVRGQLEVVGRGQRIAVRSVWTAASSASNATQWQQRRPDSLTFGISPEDAGLRHGWLQAGMVVAEIGRFSNARSFEALVEWRRGPVTPGSRVHAHVLGHSYPAEIAGVEPLSSPSRHRTTSWVGKLRTHRIFVNCSEFLPLTAGLRVPLLQYEDDHRMNVVGVAQVVSFE